MVSIFAETILYIAFLICKKIGKIQGSNARKYIGRELHQSKNVASLKNLKAGKN